MKISIIHSIIVQFFIIFLTSSLLLLYVFFIAIAIQTIVTAISPKCSKEKIPQGLYSPGLANNI